MAQKAFLLVGKTISLFIALFFDKVISVNRKVEYLALEYWRTANVTQASSWLGQQQHI